MKNILSLLISLCLAIHSGLTHASDFYQVEAGDGLQISVWKEEGLEKEILVRPDGYFTFPLAGEIEAKGSSIENIKEKLISRLDKFIPDPEVNVSLIQISSNKIYVIGKVNIPGPIVMNHEMDVLQALSTAGGMTTFAALRKVKIIRRNGDAQTVIPFNYAEVEKGKNLQQNIILKRGDVILVP